MRHLHRFSILAALYIAQGLPFGFFSQALPTLMREQGVDLQTIGMVSLLALPWALKFLWAPWLDKVSLISGGHRRGWILLANLLASVMLVILSFGDLSWWLGTGITALFITVFLLNLFAASQDISTDALAVENIPPASRGWANGIQVGGYRIGMVLGGGLILGWLHILEWQGAMLCMAALLVLSALPVLLWEREVAPVDKGDYIHAYKGLFQQHGIWLWLGLLVIYKMGDAFGTAMLRPMLVDLGATKLDIAWMLGTWGVVAGLTGAILGGALMSVLGRVHALAIFALLQALSIGAYAFLPSLDIHANSVFIICMIEHVTGGMATAAIFTVMMDYCRPTHSGLDYSLQSCVIIISGIVLGMLSGVSASVLGYEGHYAVAFGVGLIAVALIILQRKPIHRRSLQPATSPVTL